MIRSPVQTQGNSSEINGNTTERDLIAEMNKTITVRQSINEIEARTISPKQPDRKMRNKTTSSPVTAEVKICPHKPKTNRENNVTPPKMNKSYKNKTAEAKAWLMRAKMQLNNGKNIRTDIKVDVLEAVEKLYALVKESEEQGTSRSEGKRDKLGKRGLEEQTGNKTTEERENMEDDLIRIIEEHSKLIQESNEKMDKLKETLDKEIEISTLKSKSYSEVVLSNPKTSFPRQTAHSMVI